MNKNPELVNLPSGTNLHQIENPLVEAFNFISQSLSKNRLNKVNVYCLTGFH